MRCAGTLGSRRPPRGTGSSAGMARPTRWLQTGGCSPGWRRRAAPVRALPSTEERAQLPRPPAEPAWDPECLPQSHPHHAPCPPAPAAVSSARGSAIWPQRQQACARRVAIRHAVSSPACAGMQQARIWGKRCWAAKGVVRRSKASPLKTAARVHAAAAACMQTGQRQCQPG